MKNSNTKLVARVMLLILLISSAVNFVGCEWKNHFTTTTERGPLKTTKPVQDIVQNIPNTFETVETTLALENGEEIEYVVGQNWYENIEQEDMGTLVLVNGNFFSFGEGEDIE